MVFQGKTIIVVVLRSKTKEAQSWFSRGFPNKNGIFVLVFQRKTFLFTPFPRKGAGKGYQVRKLPLFTPFPRKGAGKGYQVRKLTKTVS
jgi:hypothetical protein